MHITVLGTGLVGSAIVKDLVRDPENEVTAVDVNVGALEKLRSIPRVRCVTTDIRKEGIIEGLVGESRLVVSAVPGFMGYRTLERMIEAGKDIVDISFFAEDPFLLDDQARAKGVTAVVDCGVAPGLSNIILGHVAKELDRTESFVCYVGGLPRVRHWPYEYKSVFSPIDVLEEYTRPARYVEHGREVVRPALSDVELIDFPGVGTLEAFNTDGLRTLAKTMRVPFMKEKTMRYPGHAELMRIFREGGFFGTEPVEIDGQKIKPISVVSKLMFDQWRLREGEEDVTVMRVIVEGEKGARRVRHTYDLLDRYDRDTETTSMARTTGYTCTIVARQVLKGLFTRKGICPPEYLGELHSCYENLLAEFGKRNIALEKTTEQEPIV
jgi:saccharopine dehydrogenase-like NADP-dependent oxidoreductase